MTAVTAKGRAVAEIYVELREAHDPAGSTADLRAESLVEDSPVATLVYDLHSRAIRYANRALAELTGRTQAELLGASVDELLQETESIMAEPASRPSVELVTEHLLTGEHLLQRPDGSQRHVEVRTTTVADQEAPCGQVAVWDITERVAWEQQLLHHACHDTLTGLPNSWYASIYLQRALRKSTTSHPSQRLAVFFVDLDGFKQINDTYGHHAGDAVLRQAATRLNTAVSAADLTARLHGDEFLVLCRVANAIHAAHLAQRIRRSLARPIQVGTQILTVTASVGIAVATAASEDAERLLRFADHRMYTDKRQAPVTRRQDRPPTAVTGAGSAAIPPADPA
jgi:diguanylate cyclase (GGDEF)-like protein/PAS domain S-box-containing protein